MTESTPDSPIFAPGSFVEWLGLRFTEISGSRVVAEWTARADFHQPYGIVHGGIHASVVETLGSVGAAAWFLGKGTCVGVSNSTDFYRPVTVGELVSTATPIHQGRTQQVWQIETLDAASKLIARGQLRLQNLPEPG